MYLDDARDLKRFALVAHVHRLLLICLVVIVRIHLHGVGVGVGVAAATHARARVLVLVLVLLSLLNLGLLSGGFPSTTTATTGGGGSGRIRGKVEILLPRDPSPTRSRLSLGLCTALCKLRGEELVEKVHDIVHLDQLFAREVRVLSGRAEVHKHL